MEINWLAFAAAVVAQIAAGFIWFHPSVMGTIYAKSLGVSVDDMKPKNAAMTYGLTILMTILYTLFLTLNVTGPGQDHDDTGHSFITFQHGLAHGLIFTMMVIIPLLGTPALYENKNRNWFLTQLGYWFVRTSIAFGIISMWR